MQASSKFCKVTSNLLPCSVSFDFFQSPLGLLGIVHENFTWGSTSNEAIPYRMASRSSSISSRSYHRRIFFVSFTLFVFVQVPLDGSQWLKRLDTFLFLARYLAFLFFLWRIGYSSSVLAMTCVQRSVRVAAQVNRVAKPWRHVSMTAFFSVLNKR